MKKNKELLEQMNRNPDSWKYIFYFNNKDPRVIVRKKNPSMGWTLNFANPLTYLYFFAAVGLILAIDYWF